MKRKTFIFVYMYVCAGVCVCRDGLQFWRKKAVYLEQRIMGQLPMAC